MRSLLLSTPVHRWVWGALGALALAFGVATPSRADLATTMFAGC
jgi:hypothetical protein